ncbi:MAG: cytochrome c [Gammaproteobacteria bacterium]|nr:MAG: cytochrome c [Gammaproteobacteria bacterium]
MQPLIQATLLLLASLAAAVTPARAAEPAAAPQSLALSPGTLALLRAEMVEIAGGVQGIALALASADWHTIAKTAERIRASYVMDQSLTAEQAGELEQKLPEHFKELDAAFHQRAEKLAIAARSGDAELVTYHYARLVEGCVSCHAAYATARFPGFAPTPLPEHRH